MKDFLFQLAHLQNDWIFRILVPTPLTSWLSTRFTLLILSFCSQFGFIQLPPTSQKVSAPLLHGSTLLHFLPLPGYIQTPNAVSSLLRKFLPSLADLVSLYFFPLSVFLYRQRFIRERFGIVLWTHFSFQLIKYLLSVSIPLCSLYQSGSGLWCTQG